MKPTSILKSEFNLIIVTRAGVYQQEIKRDIKRNVNRMQSLFVFNSMSITVFANILIDDEKDMKIASLYSFSVILIIG